MLLDSQVDRYSEAMMKGISREDQRVIEAMREGFKRAPKVVKGKLNEIAPDWYSVVAILYEGIALTVKVVGAGAAAGAVISASLTAAAHVGSGTAAVLPGTLPIAATAGAVFGGTLAAWGLAAAGLAEMAPLVIPNLKLLDADFKEGRQLAVSGNHERASASYAEGIAKVMMAIAAVFIFICCMKGGQKIINKVKTNFGSGSKLLTLLKKMPVPLRNLQVLAASQRWGSHIKTIGALVTSSKINDSIYIIRTCNPSRLKAYTGTPHAGKSLWIKAKSIKNGPHAGEVQVAGKDLALIKKYYSVHQLERGKHVLKRIKGKKLPGDGFTDIDGHFIVGQNTYIHSPKSNPESIFGRLLSPDGKAVIPDLDRLVCMKLKSSKSDNMFELKDMADFADDPAEISSFNKLINDSVGKDAINTNHAEHGYSSRYLDKNGKSKYQARDQETIMMIAGGKVFELNWDQMVQLCKVNKQIGLPQCFNTVEFNIREAAVTRSSKLGFGVR